MALNSMFFERTLADIGNTLEAYKKDGGFTAENLEYLRGQAFLCFRIYKQTVYNPRLLEISEKRLAQIDELAETLKPKKKTARRRKNEKG